jgi:hypothetical protein
MTRDEARKAFALSGLTYAVVTRPNIETLRKMIDAEMKMAALMDGTYRMRKICRLRMYPLGIGAELRCKSHYFDNREAVSFNHDGFIGFAGWADDNNIKPVLAGFVAWIDLMENTSKPALAQLEGSGGTAQRTSSQRPTDAAARHDGRTHD